jgi:hypothetical protein
MYYHLGMAGVSWTPRDSARNWWSVASSADGAKLVACGPFERIYTSDGTAGFFDRLTGQQFCAIEIQYVGGDLFMPLSFSGSIIGGP